MNAPPRATISPRTVAALYVVTDGTYYDLPGVDPWDIKRDARTYAGPWPVVAHPPCERWGRYWFGGPSAKVRRVKGDDAGCFTAALSAVRRWGGVLEHPEASGAWAAHGLIAPPRCGGWIAAGDWQGWTCCVEQGHYGHRARKATWLYAVRTELPSLVWGPSEASVRLEDGFRSAEHRRRMMALRAASAQPVPERLKHRERPATPAPFRDLLLAMARTARGAV